MRNKFTWLIALLIGVAACSEKELPDKKPTPTPRPTHPSISQEIKNLIYFQGDESLDTVLINTQGGPVPRLVKKEFDDLLAPVNTTNLLRINVHQMQTLKPHLFAAGEITFQQATEYDKNSVDTLYKVIKYFKDQGRKVYVLGISFGAFMTQELIAKKGIDVADGYLIMVGRLDMNEVFWRGFSEGKGGYFENGVTPRLVDNNGITEKNMAKLAAGLGKNRYTERLPKDLSKVTYVYGKIDSQVGALSDPEVQFLKSRGCNVIVGEGDHRPTVSKYIKRGFAEAFGIK